MDDSGEAFDDDDFGGFEAADPTVPCEAEPLSIEHQAATSWVIAAVASSVQQPDSKVTSQDDANSESSLKVSSDPSAHSTADTAVSSQPFDLDDYTTGTNWAAVGEDFDTICAKDGALLSNNIPAGDSATLEDDVLLEQKNEKLEQSSVSDILRSTSVQMTASSEKGVGMPGVSSQISSKPSVLDDFDLETDLELACNHSGDTLRDDKSASEISSLSDSLQTNATGEQSMQQPAPDDIHLPDPESLPSMDINQQTLTDLHALRQQQQQIKAELKQELDKLKKHNALLEDQRLKLQEQLKEQEQSYQSLQTRHRKELEDVKEAGHKAIAVIVEEYKELCKLAVLQEQDSAQQLLKETIALQTEQQAALLKKQEEEFTKQLEKLQKDYKGLLEETISSLQEQHQKEVQSILQEEARKAENAMKKAIQEEQDKQKRNIEEVVQEQQSKQLACLEEEQTKWQKELNDIKKEMLKLLENAAEEHQEKSEVHIREALKAAKDEHSEAMKVGLLDNKEQMEHYIKEQRQADRRVMQRSLVATDLFLKTARQQIKLLLQPDDNLLLDQSDQS